MHKTWLNFLFFLFVNSTAFQEKEKELAEMRLNEALLERDQTASDLNSMERSFSELFKRLEKYKEVIEGYKKVRKPQGNVTVREHNGSYLHIPSPTVL